MVTIISRVLGLFFLCLFVRFIPWFFHIPLKTREGLFGIYGAISVNLFLMIVLLLLTFGLIAKKRWVVTLYLYVYLHWITLWFVSVFYTSDILTRLLKPLWVLEAASLSLVPTLLGLFLWRHRDQFSTGILPLSWQPVSEDKEAVDSEIPH